MTAPTQQARAAILAEAAKCAEIIETYDKLDGLVPSGSLLEQECQRIVCEQNMRLLALERDLAKLEGEAP